MSTSTKNDPVDTMELETNVATENQKNEELKKIRNLSKGSKTLFQNVHRQAKDAMELKTIEANENQENEDKNGEVEEVPTEEDSSPQQDEKKMKKLAKRAGNAAKNISLIGRVPKKCRTFNMELAKALGILGFQNTRWMETSKHSGMTPKQVLDRAHFSKTMFINKQRIREEEEKEKNGGKVVFGTIKKKLSYDDQIRQLHEAYQFLIKKYKLEESVANASLMIQTLEREQKRMEKMAIQAESKKDEIENGTEDKVSSFDQDADKQKLKRKKSSSQKRTKKTPKNN